MTIDQGCMKSHYTLVAFLGLSVATHPNTGAHYLDLIKSHLQISSKISLIYSLVRSSGYLQRYYDNYCEHWTTPILRHVRKYVGSDREKELFLISRTCLAGLRINQNIQNNDLKGLLGMLVNDDKMMDSNDQEITNMFSYDPTGIWLRYFEPIDSRELFCDLYREGALLPVAFPYLSRQDYHGANILKYVKRAFAEKNEQMLNVSHMEEAELSFLICALMHLFLVSKEKDLNPLVDSIRSWLNTKRSIFHQTVLLTSLDTTLLRSKKQPMMENNPFTPCHNLLDFILAIFDINFKQEDDNIQFHEPFIVRDDLSSHYLKALFVVANNDLFCSYVSSGAILTKLITVIKSYIVEGIPGWTDTEIHNFANLNKLPTELPLEVVERLMALPPPPLHPLHSPLIVTTHLHEYFLRWIIRPYRDEHSINGSKDLRKILNKEGTLRYFHSLPKTLPNGERTDQIIIGFITSLLPYLTKVQINFDNQSITLVEDKQFSKFDLVSVRYLAQLFLHYPEHAVFEGFFTVTSLLTTEYRDRGVDLKICSILLVARMNCTFDWTSRRPFIFSKYKILQ